MSESVYEQIKDGFGLKLNKAEECFATLVEQARNEKWDHLQFLARLVDEEVTATRNRRLASRMRFAHLPGRRTLEEFDFDFQPSIDRKLVEDLASLRFVKEGRPILFLGQPGCGKTHLAVALCTLAVEAGYRGYFTSGADMCASIAAAYAEGTFKLKMRTYTGPSVLVIDDVGLVPLDRAAGNAFYQVVNRRYEMGSSTIVTTNRGLPSWGEVFGDSVVVAAILDRLMHRAVVSTLRGRRGGCANTSPRRCGKALRRLFQVPEHRTAFRSRPTGELRNLEICRNRKPVLWCQRRALGGRLLR